jgi:hypothetical protein
MTDGRKFEILLRKIAQVNNLANKLQINLDWACKVAARSVISAHKKQFDAEIDFILAKPASSELQ